MLRRLFRREVGKGGESRARDMNSLGGELRNTRGSTKPNLLDTVSNLGSNNNKKKGDGVGTN